jgi:hypothetical protein
MLVVLLLVNEGYSIEQIVLDGIMARGIDILPFDGRVVIHDGDRILQPAGVDPVASGDEDDAAGVSSLMDGIFDAVSGEDPLAAADGSYKRQYTLVLDVDIADPNGVEGMIRGTANFGERKGGRERDRLSGRGTGTYSSRAECSLSDLDTTKYPWSASAPLELGVAGVVDGTAVLSIAMRPSSAVKVTAEGESLCLSVVRDTADAALAAIKLPNVEVELEDGARATATTTAGTLTIDVAVSVREI